MDSRPNGTGDDGDEGGPDDRRLSPASDVRWAAAPAAFDDQFDWESSDDRPGYLARAATAGARAVVARLVACLAVFGRLGALLAVGFREGAGAPRRLLARAARPVAAAAGRLAGDARAHAVPDGDAHTDRVTDADAGSDANRGADPRTHARTDRGTGRVRPHPHLLREQTVAGRLEAEPETRVCGQPRPATGGRRSHRVFRTRDAGRVPRGPARPLRNRSTEVRPARTGTNRR
jgi:hypothetical protein